MPSRTKSLAAAFIALAAGLAAQEARLEFDDFTPRAAVDAGQIVKGNYSADLKLQPLNRNTVVLEQEAKYGEAWEFKAGFEGIIWWPFSVINTNTRLAPHERTIRVEPRLSESRARLNFGLEMFFELGFFPYKYNRDARNLGEYLYRSGTYPGTVSSTDGFHLLDRATFDAYGAHFHASQWGGLLGHDVNFFAEPAILPIGDVTPAYELSLSWPHFQIGAGAAYNRLLSFAPSRVRPKARENGYYEYTLTDSVGPSIVRSPYWAAPDSIQDSINRGRASVDTLRYYTQKGIKVMGRAAIDLGFLIPEGLRGPEDLRIFAEVAVLGWENQPYFYENRFQRMPVMAGVNIPAFTLLDLLSLQVEYYGSRFDNNESFIYSSWPVWEVSSTYDASQYRRDDWKWSVYAAKNVNRLFRIRAQVANDHLRLPVFNRNLTTTDLMQNPKHWYYLVRLEFGE